MLDRGCLRVSNSLTLSRNESETKPSLALVGSFNVSYRDGVSLSG